MTEEGVKRVLIFLYVDIWIQAEHTGCRRLAITIDEAEAVAFKSKILGKVAHHC